MSSNDETEAWLTRALTSALGKAPDDLVVLSALVHAGCPPTLRYRRGMQRLVGKSLCSECLKQQPALTCFDCDPTDGSCGWQVCDECLCAVLPAGDVASRARAEAAAYERAAKVCGEESLKPGAATAVATTAARCEVRIRALASAPAPEIAGEYDGPCAEVSIQEAAHALLQVRDEDGYFGRFEIVRRCCAELASALRRDDVEAPEHAEDDWTDAVIDALMGALNDANKTSLDGDMDEQHVADAMRVRLARIGPPPKATR